MGGGRRRNCRWRRRLLYVGRGCRVVLGLGAPEQGGVTGAGCEDGRGRRLSRDLNLLLNCWRVAALALLHGVASGAGTRFGGSCGAGHARSLSGSARPAEGWARVEPLDFFLGGSVSFGWSTGSRQPREWWAEFEAARPYKRSQMPVERQTMNASTIFRVHRYLSS